MLRLSEFCDGETEPRIDGPFQDLFTGKLPPFCEPIAIHKGGGWISYFPIPYRKSCRVEVTELEHPGDLYYHVQYLTYPAGTAMRTFTRELPADEQAALQRVVKSWTTPGASPNRPAPGDATGSASGDVRPGEATSIAISGPATVLSLRVTPAAPTPEVLRGLLLECAWDGGEPSVRAPVGDFFCCGFGVTK